MKINDLGLVESNLNEGIIGSYLGATGSAIAGKFGLEGSRQKAEAKIARDQFVNTFTNKFLSMLNSHVAQLKTQTTTQKQSQQAAQTTQQPPVAESLNSKLMGLLNEQTALPSIAVFLKDKIKNYMVGYTLTDVDAKINDYCNAIQNQYSKNSSPTDELRDLGGLLFDVAAAQKTQRYAASPAPDQEKESEKIDAEAQEAINTIKNLGSTNNTYQVALAALTQLRKTNPTYYNSLVSTL